MLKLTERIIRNFQWDEFEGCVTYGPRGIGKSTYNIKALAQAFGTGGKFDYERVKKWIVFPPRDFVQKVLKMKGRSMGIIWEDAGLWLFALDWYDPFVKSAVKYMNVARTDFGAILFNTPYIGMMTKKLIVAEDILRIKIIKPDDNIGHPSRPRIAKIYKPWRSVDQKKYGTTLVKGDKFNAMLPNSFYDWYKPLRDRYAQMAKEMMMQNISSVLKQKTFQTEEGNKMMPDPEQTKEFSEVVKQYA